ncbi:MAG: STAS domain-containing protein, partial [Gammaproteobacteria bacterium]
VLKVLLDLTVVSDVDISVVGSQHDAIQLAGGSGTEFALFSVQSAVRRVLELARLDRVFVIHRDLAEGLRGGD